MICSNCGTQNRADRRFCLQCGTALAQGCPNCGAANEAEARFCGNCGQALGTQSDAPPAAPSAARTTAPIGQAAERRLVSVLFADLVGFTPFAEERDAEEVRDTLQRYFDAARQVVERYGGTIEKFIGDAVMAVWGTPTAHEDDAERAVRAALDLVAVVKTLGPGINARAGVLSGEAAVNPTAIDQGMIAGDLVNTAARLQSVAPAGIVLVGESTMNAASAALAFEAAGEQVLKGKTAPIPAWRALRVVAQRRGAGRAETLETPFVGRTEEIRLVRELLHLSGRDPRARLVSITGPGGIGKSRLAWELEKYIDGVVERIYWHRGRCPAYGEGITFWALGEMVRSRAGLAEGDDDATTRRHLTETVDKYVGDASERPWILSALLALLGLEPAPQGGREMLFAAWRRFFENIAAQGTTTLVFEDLHWADSGLLDFIDHLLDWSKTAPLLIITLARPELFDKRPNWGAGRRTYTAITLDPLSAAEMRELLAALVPDLEENALQTIVQRADGIPLYAVETVRMLLADGRLEQVGASCRPTRELGDLAVPDSLRSLITSRLDGLDPTDRSLLQDAAVLGQTFTLDALAALGGKKDAALDARLRGLVRRELLTLEADPRSPERGQFAFMQSLTREVAYSTLARPERRARHLAAARYFESVGGDEIAGLLAGHYVAAHESSAAGAEADAVAAQARLALRGAAERAAALGGHEQAANYLEQAATLTTDPIERARLLERQALESDLGGRYKRGEEAARSAIRLYEEQADSAGAGRARGVLGTLLIHSQRIQEAIAELEPAAASLADDADPRVRADVLAKLARAYYRNLEAQRSVDTAEQALIIAEHHALRRTAAEAMATKGTALSMLGRGLEATPLLRGAMDLGRREGDIPTTLRAAANAAILIANQQGNDEAIRVTREALEIARTVGDLGMTMWHLGNIAVGIAYAGEPLEPIVAELDEALSLDLDEADRYTLAERRFMPAMFRGLDEGEALAAWIKRGEEVGDPQSVATGHLLRSMWAAVNGDYASASEHQQRFAALRPEGYMAFAAVFAAIDGDKLRVKRLLELASAGPQGAQSEEAFRIAARAAVAAMDGQRDEALPAFREALRLLRSLDARLEAGFVALSMARSLGGDDPEARKALAEALATFERMGAEPMIGQVRSALGAAADTPAAPDPVAPAAGQASATKPTR
ncbi:adenylate/guanylate cyclase domain-containing protein [soil metagenome]